MEAGQLVYRRMMRLRKGTVAAGDYETFRDDVLGIQQEDRRAVIFTRAVPDQQLLTPSKPVGSFRHSAPPE